MIISIIMLLLPPFSCVVYPDGHKAVEKDSCGVVLEDFGEYRVYQDTTLIKTIIGDRMYTYDLDEGSYNLLDTKDSIVWSK